jgi:hypothetical protein
MYVLQIARHSPESCPVFNESTKKHTVELMQNIDAKLEKHGIQMVGSWTDLPAHEIYTVFDIPSVEAYTGLLAEPEMMAWLSYNRVITKMVTSLREMKAVFGTG